jgi:hypothetical protein
MHLTVLAPEAKAGKPGFPPLLSTTAKDVAANEAAAERVHALEARRARLLAPAAVA